jgi:hypothetical protein
MSINPLKNLFNHLLGTEVNIKPNISSMDEKTFMFMVENLEESKKIESQVYELSHIDITAITDPLWFSIMESFKLIYGTDSSDVIFFYIHERFDHKGKVLPLKGIDGKDYYLENIKDLWAYIKHNYGEK